MKTTPNSSPSEISRRSFLGKAVKGATLTALFAGLPKGWMGTAYASDAPETTALNFGMIALTDCSPIVIAHEKGLFKKYGINSTVTKGANWAAIRDNLSSGNIQATHMLLGMPLASTMGLAGSPKKPMIIPWLLNRNGQAISLKSEWKGKVAADPKALMPFVKQAQGLGEPLSFAMTFPAGTHAMSAATNPLLLALAVDLPEMRAELLRRLAVGCSEKFGVIPCVGGRVEPLAAFYPRPARALAETQIANNNKALRAFSERCVQAGLARFETLPPEDAPCFANWNSPGDVVQPAETTVSN